MKKLKLLFILILFTVFKSYCNIQCKIYHEKSSNGFYVYADNREFCTISIRINFELNNLLSSRGNNKVFTVPPNSNRILLTELKVNDRNKRYSWRYRTLTNYGDYYLKKYNDDYKYYLPFKKNSSQKVSQGYNGEISHTGEKAIDFNMPIGTEIYSIRDGVVVKVIEHNSKGCKSKKCLKFNNEILVYHDDGTFAEYLHLKKNGALVKKGDSIKKGQLIGFSGNTGWSTGSHLHIMVFLQRLNKRTSIETKFLVEGGSKSVILKEKETYTRDY